MTWNDEVIKVKEIYELTARYDARQSFYGKAHVIEDEEGNKYLQSYDTIVAKVDTEGNYSDSGKYSQTTTRHQKEFKKQFGR